MIAFYLIAWLLEALIGAALIIFSLMQVRACYKCVKVLKNAVDDTNGIAEAAFAVEVAKLEIRSPKNAMHFVGLSGLGILLIIVTDIDWYDSLFFFGMISYLITASISYYYLDKAFDEYYGNKYGKL